jgi:hypothetical protein
MSRDDLWKEYCGFYEKPFHEQLEYNKNRMKQYFRKWEKTDLAKMLCKGEIKSHSNVPVTTYGDYPMLAEFDRGITEVTEKNPRRSNELLWEYYMRISRQVGATLDRYMVEPFYYCAKTTGTMGISKWVSNGETFFNNFAMSTVATILMSCSDEWGETKLKVGDTALNITAPVPYSSGWGARAFKAQFSLLPPLEVTDNLRDMKNKFYMVLKAIEKGKKIDVAGGIGSMFYMICRYFVEPEKFYEEYYHSMSFGVKKILLLLKTIQCKLSSEQNKTITELIPLKGVIVGGMDAQLYIDFFRREFGLEPLHAYGSTETGNVMRGDPDRKTMLVPDLVTSYLEFKSEDGGIKDLDELKMDEVYDLVATPFGSILYRYDMEDLFRVIDFRDDGMPVFTFEGRKMNIIDIHGYYRISPHTVVKALSEAGLRASDKWAVAKVLEPREHLCFLMEKTWEYTKEKAERILFEAFKKTHEDFRIYVEDFKIANPSEAIEVEYLKTGAFMRYSTIRAKMGAPMGQYKPPQVIPPDRMEIYDTLRSA